MEIADLLLKKEELPVLGKWAVVYPIYPPAMKESIDRKAVIDAFTPAYEEWYDDLKELVKNPELEHRDWIKQTYLGRRKKPSSFGFDPHVDLENGFPRTLFASPMSCVCIGYEGKDAVPYFTLPDAPDPILLFSKEKKLAYSLPDENYEHAVAIPTYRPHNIDSVATALLLRNWHVRIMNELISSLK